MIDYLIKTGIVQRKVQTRRSRVEVFAKQNKLYYKKDENRLT